MKKVLFLCTILLLSVYSFAQTQSGCISGDCENGYGTFVWAAGTDWAGDKYVGDWKDGYRHGQGTYYYASGMTYRGTYVYNQMEGYGTFTWEDKQRYEGEWKASKQHGQGTHYFTDGTKWTGQWENGEFKDEKKEEVKTGCISGDCTNGYGVYAFESGEKYEGNWSSDKRNGQGTNYYASGSVYTGQWLADQQHGYGTMTYSTGDKFAGNFSYHKRTGYGIYDWVGGDKYVGEWKDDYMHGQGTRTYSDGTSKTGLWEFDEFKGSVATTNTSGCVQGDCQTGYGVYIWDDGEKYEGYWESGKRNGQGTNTFASGAKYTGFWKNDLKYGAGTYKYKTSSIYDYYEGDYEQDKMTGQGTLYFKSGQRYEGSFKDDMYEGEGTMYNTDGTVQSGIWKNDEYVGKSADNYGCISGDCNNGSGTYVYKSGAKYIGSFKNGSISGQGTYFYDNGDKYVGYFINNTRDGQGTYTFAVDNRKYVGEWKNDKYNGNGTMYYSNGTNESGLWKDGVYQGVIENKGAAPIITWLQPEYYTNTSTTQTANLSVCIKSATELKKSQIYVNDVLLVDNASRGFNVVNTACDFTIERTIDLKNGANNIKVVVENSAGSTTSTIRTINYEMGIKQKRYALVIGNGDYTSAPLRNPANDANAIAAALREVGFDVMLYTNLSHNDMKRNIRSFGEKLAKEKGIGLFYFAGHGMQLGGENYLLPVDAVIEKEQDVELEALNLKRVLGELEYAQNEMNIVILDACRNNPFARSFRSTINGLATTTAPQGTFIAYATSPGSVAADGTGQNGLYTEELLKALKTSGVKIEDVFKQVRTQVYARSNKQQVPWENSSIFGDFYFK